MLDVTMFGNLTELLAEVTALAILASAIGFFIARWFYRSLAETQTSILHQEIMRLRRRAADSDRATATVQRFAARVRKQLKRIDGLDGFGV